jgi:hypothetical protein
MKVAVVGLGPSAEGQGEIIDSYDFVVRTKAFWAYGAKEAGTKTDAIVLFGDLMSRQVEWPQLKCEFWCSHCPKQYESNAYEFVVTKANYNPMRILCTADWKRLDDILKKHPSTGMVAVFMAMKILSPSVLGLYGFDSTTPDRPNYWHARGTRDKPPEHLWHDVLKEKRLLAEIAQGTWLGEKTETVLIWPDKPDI